MATLDDLTAAAEAVSQAVSDLIAKAQADQAATPDFQPAVDTLNQAAQAAEEFLNPAPAEPETQAVDSAVEEPAQAQPGPR